MHLIMKPHFELYLSNQTNLTRGDLKTGQNRFNGTRKNPCLVCKEHIINALRNMLSQRFCHQNETPMAINF